LIQFGKASIEAAASARAIQAQFEQVFGNLGNQAQSTIERMGKKFGMLPNRIKPSFTTTTSMFKGLGLSTEEAMGQAEIAVTAAADAAAFYDKSYEEANSALTSFIKGNYEGGESIGLFANETQMASWASKNLGVDWKNLDEAGKQVARLQFATAMQEAAGATGQASRESEGYENQVGNMKQAWTDFKAVVGEPILGVVIQGLQTVTGALQTVAGGLQTAGEKVQQFTTWASENKTMLTMIGIALGTLGIALVAYNASLITTAIGVTALTVAEKAHAVATKIATIATGGFSAVLSFLTSPITLVILAIGALIAIGVLLYKNWDTVKAKALEIWTAIKDFFSQTWQSIKATALNIWNSITSWLGGKWNSIKALAIGVFNNVKNIISTIWNGIKSVTSTVWNGIKNFLSNLWNGIKIIVSTVFNGIKKVISTIWNTIRSVTSTVWNGIKSVLSGIWNTLKSLVSTVFNSIRTKISNIWNTIKSVTSSVWNGIKSAISNVVSGIKNGVVNTFNSVKSRVASIWNGIKSAISRPINKARDLVRSAINKIKGFMDFNWSLPKLKLPHISIKGKFSLTPPKVPKFGIKWYADGAIFDKPTLFDTAAGLKGVGEAGPEAVAPIDILLDYIRAAVSESQEQGKSEQKSDINITQNIYSPEPLTPSEIARKSKNEFRKFMLEMS
jgi:phage-related protein